jgi:hypothetical protein
MKRTWQLATALLLAAIIPLHASAQLGLGGGGGQGRGGGGGGGGISVGGGARGGANVGGGGVRANTGGAVRANVAAPRVNANVAPRVNASAAPRVSTGANVGANARVNAPGATVRGTVPGASVRANVPGASVRGTVPGGATVPGASVRGTVPGANIRANVPGAAVRSNQGANVGANVRANVPGAGANVGANARTTLRPVTPDVGARVGGDIRANVDGRVRDGVRANVDGRVGDNVRTNVDGRVRGDVDARVRGDVDGRVRGDVDGRIRDNVRADVDGRVRANVRPSWFDSRVGVSSRFNTNFNRALAGTIGAAAGVNYLDNNRVRADYWRNYSRPVFNYWGNNAYPYFNNNFWTGRNIYRPFGYFNYWGYRPWGYWWGNPGWVGVNRWYGGWGGWNSPYYYDYGVGGNVVYRDNYVYVDGTNVGTADEYAYSAAKLATVEEDDLPSKNTEDWLGLGTFAVVETGDRRDNIEPTRYVQLAVDKKGFVAGTYFNQKTDEVFSVSGRVDKDTQRMAFKIDEKPDIVFETGLFNLTQDETPVLVHFGAHETETFVFARLEQPKDDGRTERTSREELP